MRKLAATLVLLVFFLSAQAQQKQIDNLKKLIATAKDDTSRIMLTNQLSHLYIYSKPDSALKLAQRGQQMAKTAQFLKGEAYCLINISGIFSITGNYPRALSASLEALKISEKINDLLILTRRKFRGSAYLPPPRWFGE